MCSPWDLTNFGQPYLENYINEKFQILTRSVFESQLKTSLNEPYPKKSSFEDISWNHDRSGSSCPQLVLPSTAKISLGAKRVDKNSNFFFVFLVRFIG